MPEQKKIRHTYVQETGKPPALHPWWMVDTCNYMACRPTPDGDRWDAHGAGLTAQIHTRIVMNLSAKSRPPSSEKTRQLMERAMCSPTTARFIDLFHERHCDQRHQFDDCDCAVSLDVNVRRNQRIVFRLIKDAMPGYTRWVH